MFACSPGRRRSRYRYFRRTSSDTGVSSAIGNGGVLASFNSTSRRTTTSTSPVGSFGLIVSADRRRTRPTAPITNSERSRLAFAMSGSSSLSNTTCVIPPRSRISTNSNPPRSRTLCTHPSRTTSAPTSSRRRAPQLCVRVRSPSCSATLLQRLENRGARRRLWIGLLRLGVHILHRHSACLDLLVAQKRDVRDMLPVSVLDLLADLVGIRIHEHPKS